jgi:restriction system protein
MATEMPTHLDLMNPLLQAMNELGGSGTIKEIDSTVEEILDLPDETLNTVHNAERGSQTEIQYRLAWARNYFKHYGLLENSSRGVWVIAADKRDVKTVDSREVAKVVRAMLRKRSEAGDAEEIDEAAEDGAWRAVLHQTLTKSLSPEGFERLIKRLLRESGFVQVEVTGRSRDGGIDGKGIVRVGGLLSFHVVFQCKRYQGSVSASQIRDFRGAMIGRADKGLFVTTGTFTKDATREALRDGAPPLDLMDGEQLADKLKELRLGIRTETVERVIVDPDWFTAI